MNKFFKYMYSILWGNRSWAGIAGNVGAIYGGSKGAYIAGSIGGLAVALGGASASKEQIESGEVMRFIIGSQIACGTAGFVVGAGIGYAASYGGFNASKHGLKVCYPGLYNYISKQGNIFNKSTLLFKDKVNSNIPKPK